ncbi:MFS general substrate transporter [Dacryopinax primogenitus]|uniref:MFS general substrate transporter n=1 Tax=Dacryopinax primogenitus (strain DJM 731) TaxID=1858805 RepID=M5G0S0_DACPD|nr:MFS general substrate transporter [Dacryopinax primogenitus]EJU02344.1 MFS general substrate transporter [Dacryopinax primogenitus]
MATSAKQPSDERTPLIVPEPASDSPSDPVKKTKFWWYELHEPEALPMGHTPTEEMCEIPSVVTAYTIAVTVMGIVDAISSMISFGLVNLFVKKYGRKPVFVTLTSVACTAFSCFILALNVHGTLALVLAGLAIVLAAFASVGAIVLVGRMYIVDTTSPQERTSGLSFLGAAATLGLTPSFVLGGYITEHWKHVTAVYWVTLALQVCVLLYEVFFLPESYVLAERREAIEEMQHVMDSDLADDGKSGLVHSLKQAVRPILSILEPLLVLIPIIPGQNQRDCSLLIAGFASFLWFAGSHYLGLAVMMRLINEFHSPPDQNGLGISLLMGGKGLFLVFVFPSVIRYGRKLYARYAERRGMHLTTQEIMRRTDTVLIVGSDIIDAFFISMIGVSKTKYGVFASALLMGFGAGGHIALNSLLVSSVHHSQSDEILSANAMLESVGQVLSPVILGSILSATITTIPGLMFYVSTCICLTSATCIVVFRAVDRPERRIHGEGHTHYQPQEEEAEAVETPEASTSA